DLLAFLPDLEPHLTLFPNWELQGPNEGNAPAEAVGEQLAILQRLLDEQLVWIVAPVEALLRRVPSPEEFNASARRVRKGERIDRDALAASLVEAGYERLDLVIEKGQFAIRGGILDAYSPDAGAPVRLEWFGDEVESIRLYDPETQRSTQEVEETVFRPAAPQRGSATLLDFLPPASLVVLDEPLDLERQAAVTAERAREIEPDAFIDWSEVQQRLHLASVRLSSVHPPDDSTEEMAMHFGGVEAFGGQMKLLARAIESWQSHGRRVVVASAQAERITEILRSHAIQAASASAPADLPQPGHTIVAATPLSRGFQIDAAGLVVLTDSEIVGWRRRRRRFRFREGVRLYSWTDLSSGDYVVHIHHGIGLYRGLVRLLLNGAERDYLELAYAQNDKLYVPTDQINLVQRYIGVEGQPPKVHRLGGTEWEREKKRVKEAAQQMARELLTLYATREAAPGHAFSPDTPWQHELEATFEFEETPDQWLAIQDVKRDMETPKPMDRLIAGDVGYGKTEVALRAGFKAVMDGKQVAVLVPTTILAQQHYNVFLKRLAAYPMKVEMLSRFRSSAEQKRIIEQVKAGLVDVLIGTHRVLQKDVAFKNLGLVIIDEEQRFGVRHKEKLKQLRATVDVLTLTATPIPRTLHMSLVGLRDMSVMETPPEARLPIFTEIRPEDDQLIREAIMRELDRGGQVYVVHNRVQTIERAARRIRALVPEASVAVAHGQMPEEKLEEVMMDFLGGRFNVLVCTTIVEIGLDIPQVNTILVEDAHMMGLSQLYQLRGRVGRSDRQAYCYLLYPRGANLSEEARQRLLAMQEFVELGSGFKLAMRDLEIRGAGNLLGPEQHGHLAAVGFELYSRLLDEAIRELRGEMVEEVPDAAIDLGIDAYLPQEFIADEGQRMAVYRKLAAARTIEDASAVAEEVTDRYGALPEPAATLIEVVRLRALARQAGVAAITREQGRIVIKPAAGWTLSREDEARLISQLRGRLTITPTALRLRVGGTRFTEDAGLVRQTLLALARSGRRHRETAAAST
ncbi:MAG: transcription-repair coupling factor, partial [Armatimonadetes bacterium]|nr:transcription-repair coupling factor [Armatimonadota bacterium]